MAQPAPKPIDPTAIMLRVADEVGVAADDLQTIARTVRWFDFKVLEPHPGKELGQVYRVFAIFHGCKGEQGEDGMRVPGEQRVYCYPIAQTGSPPLPPFARFTYLAEWRGEFRQEVMSEELFVEEVSEEFSLLLELGDEECPFCNEGVRASAKFCESCGKELPEEEDEKPEASAAAPS